MSYKSSIASFYETPKQNVTKTFLNDYKFQKQRTLTPEKSFDDSDLLSVYTANLRKKHSQTPEKRSLTPNPEQKSLIRSRSPKLTTSQTSLMSRQSNSSRNSTMEREKKRYEDDRLSRSSSSSSYSEHGNNTRRVQSKSSLKTNFGDYRIRRSR